MASEVPDPIFQQQREQIHQLECQLRALRSDLLSAQRAKMEAERRLNEHVHGGNNAVAEPLGPNTSQALQQELRRVKEDLVLAQRAKVEAERKLAASKDSAIQQGTSQQANLQSQVEALERELRTVKQDLMKAQQGRRETEQKVGAKSLKGAGKRTGQVKDTVDGQMGGLQEELRAVQEELKGAQRGKVDLERQLNTMMESLKKENEQLRQRCKEWEEVQGQREEETQRKVSRKPMFSKMKS